MKPAARWRLFCLVLMGVGASTSGYLLLRAFALMQDVAPAGYDLCSRVFGANCDAALLSETSWQLGIPLAGWGVVYYLTLACLVVLGWALGESFEAEALLGALAVSVAGAVASVVLAVVSLTGKTPFCPLCTEIQILNLVLAPAFIMLNRRTAPGVLQRLRSGARDPAAARWKAAGFLIPALLAIVLYQWVLVQSERRVRLAEAVHTEPDAAVADFAQSPQRDIPIGPDDPWLGPDDAPVILVVFSDFQCPMCQGFANDMNDLAGGFGGGLAIVFKHYPLGMACNEQMDSDLHPQACDAALAAVAAHRQGRFWPFHDALFGSEIESEEDIRRLAEEWGLDMAQFDADRHSPDAAAKVAADIALGDVLEISGTPTVFLNGREVRNRRPLILETIIRQELSEAASLPRSTSSAGGY